jgi:hypothetical protein
MTSPMTLTVEPTATAPALILRPWQDSDIPATVDGGRDEPDAAAVPQRGTPAPAQATRLVP